MNDEVGQNPPCCISFQVSRKSTRHAAALVSAMTGTENGKDATDDRFRILHLLFKLGATPIFPVTGSRLYAICRQLFLLCSYITPPMMIMGALYNLDDIPYVMEVGRPLITIFSILWMHLSIRYLSYSYQACALHCSAEFSSNKIRQKHERKIQTRSRSHCYREKVISITYDECVRVALVIQHAIRMRHVVCGPQAVPYFSTLSHKRYDFTGGGKVIEHKTCALIFSVSFVRKFSHSQKNSSRYYHKCPLVFM